MGQRIKFVYQLEKNKFLLCELTPREIRHDYPKAELIRQFHDLVSARTFCSRLSGEVIDLVTRRDKFDSEHRQKLRENKLGARNPNSKGLTQKHRTNIGSSMRGKNLAQLNVNYGRRRSLDIRARISRTKKEQASIARRRWCVSDTGKEFLVLPGFILPSGWSWGRKRLRV